MFIPQPATRTLRPATSSNLLRYAPCALPYAISRTPDSDEHIP